MFFQIKNVRNICHLVIYTKFVDIFLFQSRAQAAGGCHCFLDWVAYWKKYVCFDGHWQNPCVQPTDRAYLNGTKKTKQTVKLNLQSLNLQRLKRNKEKMHETMRVSSLICNCNKFLTSWTFFNLFSSHHVSKISTNWVTYYICLQVLAECNQVVLLDKCCN